MKKYEEIKATLKNWPTLVKKYQKANHKKATIQVLNSFLPFLALSAITYVLLDNYSFWYVIPISIVAAFFLVRIFIIQHDCGHQSFTNSKKANNIIGFICSFLSLIPYAYWAKSHNFHHAHNGMLDHDVRDIGDLPTLTVEEYKNASKFKKVMYRIFRSPLVMFIIIPMYYMTIHQRIPFIFKKGWKQVRIKLLLSNLYLILFYGGLYYLLGTKILITHAMTLFFFGIIAIWFFYIQHQHEEGYKEWKEQWQYLLASIQGSSFYKLPKLFQWLSGNIGFHHIHHLSSLIPNYNLEKCNKENPILEKYAPKLTFWKSLQCMHNKLWDEKLQKMITWKEYKKLYT